MVDFKDVPQGLKPRWIKRSTCIDNLRRSDPRPVMTKVLNYIRYGQRDDLDSRIKYIDKQDFQSVALHDECQAIFSALEGKPTWLDELATALRYYLFYDRLDYFWHTKSTHFRDGAGLSSQDFDCTTNSMAYCFMLGWVDQAIYQGYLTYAVMNQGFQFVNYGTGHKHAHTFMLRLFADWRGDVSHPFLDWAYEVPLYEGLLERWREPDPEALKPWLQLACEYHAHEAKPDTSRTFFDFGGDYRIMRTPLEIHMILRLRELEGLQNPRIEHELMAQPFDVLMPPQPVLPPDELMLGTLKRVREEWPDFDQVTALDTIRSIPPKPWKYTTEQARKLLGL